MGRVQHPPIYSFPFPTPASIRISYIRYPPPHCPSSSQKPPFIPPPSLPAFFELHIERRKQINLMTCRNLGNLGVSILQQLPHILQQFGVLLMRTLTQRLNERPRQGPTCLPVDVRVCTGLIIPTAPKLDHVCLALVILLCPSTGRLVVFRSHEQFPHCFQPRKKRGGFIACQEMEPHVGEAAHDLNEGREEGGRIRQGEPVPPSRKEGGGSDEEKRRSIWKGLVTFG